MRARRSIAAAIIVVLLGGGGWILWEEQRARNTQPKGYWLDEFQVESLEAIIPHFEMTEFSIEEAVALLNRHARELIPPPRKLWLVLWKEGDPIPQGMERSPVEPEEPEPSPPPAIPGLEALPSAAPPPEMDLGVGKPFSLTNLPLSEAVRFVATLAGLHWYYSEGTYWLYPRSQIRPTGVTRHLYLVSSLNVLPAHTTFAALTHRNANRTDLKPYLISNGVTFRSDNEAWYEPRSKHVIIRALPEQFDRIETIFSPFCKHGPPSRMTRV